MFEELRFFLVIYQTPGTVFQLDIRTPRRELKIPGAAEYFFDEI